MRLRITCPFHIAFITVNLNLAADDMSFEEQQLGLSEVSKEFEARESYLNDLRNENSEVNISSESDLHLDILENSWIHEEQAGSEKGEAHQDSVAEPGDNRDGEEQTGNEKGGAHQDSVADFLSGEFATSTGGCAAEKFEPNPDTTSLIEGSEADHMANLCKNKKDKVKNRIITTPLHFRDYQPSEGYSSGSSDRIHDRMPSSPDSDQNGGNGNGWVLVENKDADLRCSAASKHTGLDSEVAKSTRAIAGRFSLKSESILRGSSLKEASSECEIAAIGPVDLEATVPLTTQFESATDTSISEDTISLNVLLGSVVDTNVSRPAADIYSISCRPKDAEISEAHSSSVHLGVEDSEHTEGLREKELTGPCSTEENSMPTTSLQKSYFSEANRHLRSQKLLVPVFLLKKLFPDLLIGEDLPSGYLVKLAFSEDSVTSSMAEPGKIGEECGESSDIVFDAKRYVTCSVANNDFVILSPSGFIPDQLASEDLANLQEIIRFISKTSELGSEGDANMQNSTKATQDRCRPPFDTRTTPRYENLISSSWDFDFQIGGVLSDSSDLNSWKTVSPDDQDKKNKLILAAKFVVVGIILLLVCLIFTVILFVIRK